MDQAARKRRYVRVRRKPPCTQAAKPVMEGPQSVRIQSARRPLKTIAPHRHQSPKGQVSAPRATSPQVTNLAHY